MVIKKYKSLLLMLLGALFQVIFWKSDILFVGILGYALFIGGMILLPDMCKPKKVNNNSEKRRKKECGDNSSAS